LMVRKGGCGADGKKKNSRSSVDNSPLLWSNILLFHWARSIVFNCSSFANVEYNCLLPDKRLIYRSSSSQITV
jgi:hypothetical protein